MPHKRAKRSVTEQEKARRATDLAPEISIEYEPVPKSVSRVLDAGRIRREYREKKQRLDGVSEDDRPRREKRRHHATRKEDGGDALKIGPSETVTQFNRRVDSTMMPLVKTALRQSSAQARRVRREAAGEPSERSKRGEKGRHPPPEISRKGSDPLAMGSAEGFFVNPRNATTEFRVVPTSAPRRLNDVAQEPPEIKTVPRGAAKSDGAPSGVSMAQRAMMEEEREKAIRHYRELKARRVGINLEG